VKVGERSRSVYRVVIATTAGDTVHLVLGCSAENAAVEAQRVAGLTGSQPVVIDSVVIETLTERLPIADATRELIRLRGLGSTT
jgi:hypothetical protein